MNLLKNPRNLWLVFVVALLVIVPPVRSQSDKVDLQQAELIRLFAVATQQFP